MPLLTDDLIAETTTTTGTGTVNLDGAQTGYSRFRDFHADGARVGYALFVPGGDFERGIGRLTFGTPDTITRDVVLVSSNGNTNLVNFAAGPKQITGSFQTSVGSQIAALGAVRAHRNGTDQSITGGSPSEVDYTTEDYDDEGWFDLTTNEYVPQLPGRYLIVTSCGITDPTSGSSWFNNILKNGIVVSRKIAHAGSTGRLVIMNVHTVAMNGSTDDITHTVQTTATGSRNLAGNPIDTFFEAYRVN